MSIVNGAFESWEPPQPGFDLVFAATAWHWIDPAVRYRKAWDLLRDGGHLAFWSAAHAFPAALIVPIHHDGWAHLTQDGADLEQAFTALRLRSRLQMLKPGVATPIDLAK